MDQLSEINECKTATQERTNLHIFPANSFLSGNIYKYKVLYDREASGIRPDYDFLEQG